MLALLIVLAAILVIVYFWIRNNMPEQAAEDPAMTKEEVIRAFYDNFDAFEDVAEYVLSADSRLALSLEDNKFYTYTNEGPIAVDGLDLNTLEIGEQLKIICDLGFGDIGNYGADTGRVFFNVKRHPSDTGSRGVIYVPEGIKGIPPQDILEKENWHYFFFRYE